MIKLLNDQDKRKPYGSRVCGQLGQFVAKCLDKDVKVYKATYLVDGEECVHYLCERHAKMESFKEGLIRLEFIVTT